MARDAQPTTAAGHGGRAVIDPLASGLLPIEVLAPVTAESITAHVRAVHRWPAHVVADATPELLLRWHEGEHRALDAPTDPTKNRPPVHLLHRHDPKARRATPAHIPRSRRPSP